MESNITWKEIFFCLSCGKEALVLPCWNGCIYHPPAFCEVITRKAMPVATAVSV